MSIEMENQTTKRTNEDTKTLQGGGPKRFLLFDGLIVNIVDYDVEDGAPIVEFSLCRNQKEGAKLPVECGICPDVMHRKHLEAHIEKNHIKYIKGLRRFGCIVCEEHFASRVCAAGHLRRHEGIRPYVCESCKVYYCTKQDLKMHQRRRHATLQMCEICGKEFAENSALRSHILSSHENKRRFSCEHCGKQFLRKYAMTEHIRNVHLYNRRLLDCTFCDKVFNDSHKLAQHRKLEHLNQSSFECRACGLVFTTIDFLEGHRRSLQCREKYRQNKESIEQQIVEEQTQSLQESFAGDIIEEEIVGNQAVIVTNDGKQVILDDDGDVIYEIAVENMTEIG